MGSLVTNASPFLFPCTIEYSLICAVILFEMWKKVKTIDFKSNSKENGKKERKRSSREAKSTMPFSFSK